MNGLLILQVVSALLSVAAVWLNLSQAKRWRDARRRMRPVFRVIDVGNERRELDIIGRLPDTGAVLFVIDNEPPPPTTKAFQA